MRISDTSVIGGAPRPNFQLDGLWVALRPGCTLLPTLGSAWVDGCGECGSHCRRCAKCLGEPFEERLGICGRGRIQRGKVHVFNELEKNPLCFQRKSSDLFFVYSSLILKCFFRLPPVSRQQAVAPRSSSITQSLGIIYLIALICRLVCWYVWR